MREDFGIEVVSPGGDGGRDRTMLDDVRTFLARHEAINSIQLSALHGTAGFPDGWGTLVALRDGAVAAVANSAGDFNALVSHTEDLDAVRVLVRDAAARDWHIPGVMATSEVSRAFADAWQDATGIVIAPGMAQRLLATSMVTPPVGVPGRWRHTTPEDSAFLREWFTAFAKEADRQPADRAAEMAESMVRRSPDGLIWLAAKDEPVSVACYKARTPRGMRIGPVFTPVEQRRRGYAAAVTAATTQHLLDNGLEFVCLYTVAANATANHVYESIGYEWVADSMIYRFVTDTDEES